MNKKKATILIQRQGIPKNEITLTEIKGIRLKIIIKSVVLKKEKIKRML